MKSSKNDKDLSNTGGEPRQEMQPPFRSVATLSRAEPTFSAPFTGSHLDSKLSPTVDLNRQQNKTKKWCVDRAKPKPIYPLERPVTVPDLARTVSARICDSLRLRSVEVVKFDESQAICKTIDYIEYSIDLYCGQDDSTVVEVMRRKGCGFAFRRDREAVLNAAKGNGGLAPSKLPFIMQIPDDMLQDYEPPTEQEHEDTLSRASDMLHSSKRDVQLFALENLSSITTADKLNTESAKLMSRLIMQSSFDIRDIVLAVLNSCISESDETSERILNSCLTIFSNSMSLLSDGKSLEAILLKQEGSAQFTESLVRYSIDIVKQCKSTHNACLALKCLCVLLKNSSSAREIVDDEARMVVVNAESFGKQRHFKLEKEAQSTLAALRCQ